MTATNDLKEDEILAVRSYAAALAGVVPSYEVKSRPDGSFLIFEFSTPNNRLFDLLNQVNEKLEGGNSFKDRMAIVQRSKKPTNLLAMPEIALLQRELSASLTVDRYTFGADFMNRYMESVTGLERAIVIHANHVVYGRRGSGKSSLLMYAVHKLRESGLPSAWVAMQTYSSRTDIQAVAGVLAELFAEAAAVQSSGGELSALSSELLLLGEQDDESQVRTKLLRMVPRMRKLLAMVAQPSQAFTIFLDDLHVLGKTLQPELLAFVYSLARGNNIYIKISGIEQLTNLWDGSSKKGLETPHDIQVLMLDHNLTSPDQSKAHITSILDRHARFCGLPDIQYIASNEYLDRLVLSAAAVPRDALSLFTKSISRSMLKTQKSVSITSLNAATSESIEEKLKDVDKDVGSYDQSKISIYLDQVKKFCLAKQKQNSFLVKIANGTVGYESIQNLVALRFVHVLHEGITPHAAGERYMALMLDYGFYIGIRAAKSIKLFPELPRPMAAKELRRLPILTPN